MQDEILKNLAAGLEQYIKPALDREAIKDIVSEAISAACLPAEVVVKSSDGVKMGSTGRPPHKAFMEVLGLVNEGAKNIMLIGPAGSGKTSLASDIAKALGRQYGFLSLTSGISESHILGRMLPVGENGKWEFILSQFLKLYQTAGVFLLDEMDAADANVMLCINTALANGHISNPIDGKLYQRHKDCIIIAACNTYGRGGDFVYCGRNQLDAATLDRFVLAQVWIDYDEGMESRLCKASLKPEMIGELLDWVKELRDKIKSNKLRRVASTRLVEAMVRARLNGTSLDGIKNRFFLGWSKDEREAVNYHG